MIEEESNSFIKAHSKKETSFPILKKIDYKGFLRRFPTVVMILLILLMIHILTFVLGKGPTDKETALIFGAIESTSPLPQEAFRLLSYLFVQTGGTWHLIVYSLVIFLIAPSLERIYGPVRLPILFSLTGMIGGYFILGAEQGLLLGSVALSLYGLIGIHIGLFLRGNSIVRSENQYLFWGSYVALILFMYLQSHIHIPISAQLSAFISGIVLSFLVKAQPFKRFSTTSWLGACTQTLLTFSLIFIIVFGAPKLIPLADVYSKNAINNFKSKVSDSEVTNVDGKINKESEKNGSGNI